MSQRVDFSESAFVQFYENVDYGTILGFHYSGPPTLTTFYNLVSEIHFIFLGLGLWCTESWNDLCFFRRLSDAELNTVMAVLNQWKELG